MQALSEDQALNLILPDELTVDCDDCPLDFCDLDPYQVPGDAKCRLKLREYLLGTQEGG